MNYSQHFIIQIFEASYHISLGALGYLSLSNWGIESMEWLGSETNL